MTDLVDAYQRNNITEFEKTLKNNRRTLCALECCPRAGHPAAAARRTTYVAPVIGVVMPRTLF